MQAIILAGGKGTRLHPITLEIPKPLLTVRKKPILSYLVDMFQKNGVKEIRIVVNHAHEDDFRFWKMRYHSGQNIFFQIEQEALGTFGALMPIKDFIKKGEPFFVTNGDELKDVNLKKFLAFHKNNDSTASIALAKVEDPRQYGVAICDKDKIVEFLEKPENPPSKFISSGLYLLDKKIFDHYPHGKKIAFSMIEKDLFPKLARQNKLYGFKFDGGWHDCGTFDRWENAIKNWQC